MQKNKNIAIIGAGFAGLASATLLARAGHQVTVFEKFASPQAVGAGILIQPTGLAAMRTLGVADEILAHGAKADWLYGVNQHGRRVIDIRYARWQRGSYGLGLHRGVLFNALWRAATEAGVQIQTGREVQQLQGLQGYYLRVIADGADLQKAGLQAWKDTALALNPACAELLAHITHMEQLTWARYHDVVMPRYHTPGQADCTVVIGDAAHATSPQLGQGTNLALLDPVALAQCLSSAKDMPSALAAYTQVRRGHLHFYSQASRMLTPLFQSDLTLLPWLRDVFLATSAGWPVLKGVNLQTLVGVRKGWLGGQLNLLQTREQVAKV
jgi:2-polyprenyl-6-methoxyphenol hydroxylase-like FAD-dependent oxidoreductase